MLQPSNTSQSCSNPQTASSPCSPPRNTATPVMYGTSSSLPQAIRGRLSAPPMLLSPPDDDVELGNNTSSPPPATTNSAPQTPHKPPIIPIAAVHAPGLLAPPKVSSRFPVTDIPTTLVAELMQLATEKSMAPFSGEQISAWFADHPPLDRASAARANEVTKVPAVAVVARLMARNAAKAKDRPTPVMSFEARDLDISRLLTSHEYHIPPRMEKTSIVR